jgi:hypothetical protein
VRTSVHSSAKAERCSDNVNACEGLRKCSVAAVTKTAATAMVSALYFVMFTCFSLNTTALLGRFTVYFGHTPVIIDGPYNQNHGLTSKNFM